jgi:hypothetical protein
MQGRLEDLRRAQHEQECAARAAEIARRHEILAQSGRPQMAETHAVMANAHRATERRHLATAAIYLGYARRIHPDVRGVRAEDDPPARAVGLFAGAVADALRVPAVTLSINAGAGVGGLVSSSSDLAVKVHELEVTLGEGPEHEVAGTHEPVLTTAGGMAQRWPNFGWAAAALGPRGLAAVPLSTGATTYGALVVLDPPDRLGRQNCGAIQVVADAIGDLVLDSVAAGDGADVLATLAGLVPLFAEADYGDVVHQAVGILRARTGYDTDDAMALLRAKAYAADLPIADIAEEIVTSRSMHEG